MSAKIGEAEYKTLSWSDRMAYTKEWFCTCNECGETWHYLALVETQMNMQEVGNSLKQE